MMLPELSIRSMKAADLAFAAECTAAEGWVSENYTSIECFFDFAPAGCLIAELAGQPVGIGVATPYGHCGFIGELIVRPEGRGLGIGAALLNHAIDFLRQRGARTIYLDGVVKAVELYERNGFRKLCRSLRFSGTLNGKNTPEVRPMLTGDLPAVFALDLQAFGADRSFFLARRLDLYPELCQVLIEGGELAGFILGRRGEGWISAGPWVVNPKAQAPISLLEGFSHASSNQPFSIGVLATNTTAVSMIQSFGFVEHSDSPWRMALGPDEDLGTAAECLAVGTAAKG